MSNLHSTGYILADDGTLESCYIEAKLRKHIKSNFCQCNEQKKAAKLFLPPFSILLNNYFANEAVCVVSAAGELICVFSAANLSRLSFGVLPITKICS